MIVKSSRTGVSSFQAQEAGPSPGFSSGCASITDECNVLINNDLLNIKTRCAVDNNINKYSGNYYAEAAR